MSSLASEKLVWISYMRGRSKRFILTTWTCPKCGLNKTKCRKPDSFGKTLSTFCGPCGKRFFVKLEPCHVKGKPPMAFIPAASGVVDDAGFSVSAFDAGFSSSALDKMTLGEIRAYVEHLAEAKHELLSIKATLVVNCAPGRTLSEMGIFYNKEASIHDNLYKILTALTLTKLERK